MPLKELVDQLEQLMPANIGVKQLALCLTIWIRDHIRKETN